MIELLIVIAILGVLAAGVVVAINPAEKINQAKDANSMAAASQLYTAAQNFYVSSGGTVIQADGSYGGQQPLVNAGELKTIIKADSATGGPNYYTSSNANWVSNGDFEVAVNLLSKHSLQVAKAQLDATAQNCGSGSTVATYYIYLSQGSWHYWCDHL